MYLTDQRSRLDVDVGTQRHVALRMRMCGDDDGAVVRAAADELRADECVGRVIACRHHRLLRPVRSEVEGEAQRGRACTRLWLGSGHGRDDELVSHS